MYALPVQGVMKCTSSFKNAGIFRAKLSKNNTLSQMLL
jgi:hypothetical protein